MRNHFLAYVTTALAAILAPAFLIAQTSSAQKKTVQRTKARIPAQPMENRI